MSHNGQFQRTALILTKHRLDELRSHRDYFRHYFGPSWDAKLALRAGTYHQQLGRVISGRDSLGPTLLQRLRLVRTDLENALAGYE